MTLAINSLAHFGGVSGMIGGQVADIFAEGILDGKSKRAQILLKNKLFKGSKMPQYFLLPKEGKEVSAAALLAYIHANKTGALITTAVEVGALLAGATGNNLKNIKTYASKIGFAFQVVDDILDAKNFIGRAPSQTVEFIANEIDPILLTHNALLGQKGDVRI